MPHVTNSKTAQLYRMVMPGHVCPYGLKSKDLLERQGFEVEDHPLDTREDTDAFMEKHGVETTPQTFIGDERIGGYDDLRVFFDIDPPEEEQSDTTYQPVIAIFSVAALLALGLSWHQYGSVLTLRGFEWFISLSMTILAIQKLQDVEGFSTMFLNYDLLARNGCDTARSTRSAKLGRCPDDCRRAAVALGACRLFIGTVGAVSVFKLFISIKRELKCA